MGGPTIKGGVVPLSSGMKRNQIHRERLLLLFRAILRWTGFKNILLSIVCSQNIQSDIKGRGWGTRGTESKKRSPRELGVHPRSDAWVPRASLGFQLRGTSLWKAQEEADPSSRWNYRNKDSWRRKQTSRAYNKTTNALLLFFWLVATTKPSPDSPDVRVLCWR